MCEQTPLQYNHGDVVWTKLGSCWWPGEVVSYENLPADVRESFHKPPLVSVRFFEEDNFQFVKNLSSIYSYNCSKKYDFIKKGLKLHREKQLLMEKFPSDVCKAEARTGGDPNILNDPKVTPQKRPDIDAIFGPPSGHKRTAKDSPRPKGRSSIKKSSSHSSAKKISTIITHPRFIGNDNHVVRELIQLPVKHSKPESDYKCQLCDFKSTRIDVIVLHHKLHLQGTIVSPRKQKRSPLKKPPKSQRISFTKTSTIDEDIALLSKGLPIFSDSSISDSSDEEDIPTKRKRRVKTKGHVKKKNKVVPPPVLDKPKDIQKDLLAEWDDDEDEEEEREREKEREKEMEKERQQEVVIEKNQEVEVSADQEKLQTSEISEANEEDSIRESKNESKSEEIEEKMADESEEENKEKNKDSPGDKAKIDSCFDFNEEEEEFGTTIEGRKIPRVIPPVEKRKSLEEEEDLKEETEILMKDMQAINSVLDECTVPVLPDLPHLKAEKPAITSKFPDTRSSSVDSKSSSDFDVTRTEQDVEKMIVATKLTNPKKRFVKTFEDETKNSTKEKDKEKEEEKDKIMVAIIEEKPIIDEKLLNFEEQASEKLEDNFQVVQEMQENTSDENKESQIDERKESRDVGFGINLEVSKLKTQLMQKLIEGPISAKEKEEQKKRTESFSRLSNSESEDDYDFEECEPKKYLTSQKMRRKCSLTATKDNDTSSASAIESFENSTNPEGTTSDQECTNSEITDPEKNIVQDIIEVMNLKSLEEKVTSPVEKETKEIISENTPPSDIFPVEVSTPTKSPSIEIASLEINPMDIPLTEIDKEEKTIIPESDLVDIEGNLTVVSEKDLADKQVEITAISEIQKPVTLTSFSLDFCEDIPASSAEAKSPGSSSDGKEEESMEIDVPKEGNSEANPNKEINSFVEERIESEDDLLPKPFIDEKQANSLKNEQKEERENEIKREELRSKENEMVEGKKVEFDVEQFLNEQKEPETGTAIVKEIKVQVNDEVKISDFVAESVRKETSSPTKLLEILTSDKTKATSQKSLKIDEPKTKIDKNSKFSIKPMVKDVKPHKSFILSEKLIKPISDSENVQVKKVTTKRSYQDIEDIDTFIIQKPIKKLVTEDVQQSQKQEKSVVKPMVKGKPRILQQTIITPSGDIIQPAVTQTQEDLYDINSMPIVLSDQILTPENIDTVPVVLQQENVKQINPIKKTIVTTSTTTAPQMKLLNKTVSSNSSKESTSKLTPIASKSYVAGRQKVQKVYQTSSTKLLKPSIITQHGKPGKFIIVPSTTSQPTGTKYTVGKRPTIVKKPQPQKIQIPTSNVPQTSTGNKIMILTDSQGQQQKVLLTPAQQKHLIGPKKRIIQKQILSKDAQAKGANIISQTIVTSKGQVTTVGTSPVIQQNLSKNIKIEPKLKRPIQQKVFTNSPLKAGPSGQQRTIIIKNPQGQTVKKMQGGDDSLLDQQVAEQLQAINRAAAKNQLKDVVIKTTSRPPAKKSYMKKEVKSGTTHKQLVQSIPPLAPISPTKKSDSSMKVEEKQQEPKKPQFVIRDGNGALININEGQILALPSEAIDGQPQSYVLVTIDEAGNLTPLNSEALMSLDPNLNLGGDLSNTVLQIEQGAHQEGEVQLQIMQETHQEQSNTVATPKEVEKEEQEVVQPVVTETQQAEQGNVQAVVNAGDMGQLIITGDPVSAQKFLDSLAEGNTDLANLLANTEGNVLIQADGQQILINTDSDNSMLLVNQDISESCEGSGNPVFSGQAVNKNQDILAAALADTDVFQQEQSIGHSPSKVVTQSQLSPNSGLFPINVGNVLETNTMSSPIMTPLEVPSTNNKKIGDENDILNQDPKNVVLPITITDPSISQTAAQHQQVASLMGGDLPTNLDLPLAIQDPGMLVTSSGMNSPSFVYSLPTLDDSDINQKSFSSSISMPLLTEEPEDIPSTSTESIIQTSEVITETIVEAPSKEDVIDKILSAETKEVIKCSAEEEETPKHTAEPEKTETYSLRPEMCNSLSEPPPDMFEFTIDSERPTPEMDSTSSSMISNSDNMDLDRTICSDSSMEDKLDDAKQSPASSDHSCEIPVQPRIIADLTEKSFEENGTSEEQSFSADGDI